MCSHPEAHEIDLWLTDTRKSVAALCKAKSLNRTTVDKHKFQCLTERHAQAVEIHRGVDAVLEAKRTTSELESLYATVRADWDAARERGEWSLAIKAVRELTRMYELQARLAIEASEGRAADVARHPVFAEFMSALVTELADMPDALQRINALCLKKLGRSTALPVGTPGGVPGE